MITETQAETLIDLLVEIRDLLKQGAAAPRSAGTAPAATSHGLTGWRAMMLPAFAKYDKDVPLGLLGVKSMEYWQAWQPKSWTRKSDSKEMPPSPGDLALRKALDEAQAEINAGTHVVPQYSPRKEGDSKPAPRPGTERRSSRPAPPPQDSKDEDVPF